MALDQVDYFCWISKERRDRQGRGPNHCKQRRVWQANLRTCLWTSSHRDIAWLRRQRLMSALVAAARMLHWQTQKVESERVVTFDLFFLICFFRCLLFEKFLNTYFKIKQKHRQQHHQIKYKTDEILVIFNLVVSQLLKKRWVVYSRERTCVFLCVCVCVWDILFASTTMWRYSLSRWSSGHVSSARHFSLTSIRPPTSTSKSAPPPPFSWHQSQPQPGL